MEQSPEERRADKKKIIRGILIFVGVIVGLQILYWVDPSLAFTALIFAIFIGGYLLGLKQGRKERMEPEDKK